MRFARGFFASLQNDGMERGMAAQRRSDEALVREIPIRLRYASLRAGFRQARDDGIGCAAMRFARGFFDKLRMTVWGGAGWLKVAGHRDVDG
jgi:hypothetical protein